MGAKIRIKVILNGSKQRIKVELFGPRSQVVHFGCMYIERLCPKHDYSLLNY